MNNKQTLTNTFGVPRGLETGYSIGGKNGNRIMNGTTHTRLHVGGPTGRRIMLGNNVIGSISVHGRIYARGGRETRYVVGGRTGRKILYRK